MGIYMNGQGKWKLLLRVCGLGFVLGFLLQKKFGDVLRVPLSSGGVFWA